MSRSYIVVLALGAVLGSAALVEADVRSDEKTHFQFSGVFGKVVNIFGGKGAREGVTSIVAVKGNRKITMNDNTGQINAYFRWKNERDTAASIEITVNDVGASGGTCSRGTRTP